MGYLRPTSLVAVLLLGASCAFLARSYRPPHAPKEEAAKVKFPWGTPRQTVVLSGVWLRAITMALDDFLPEEEAERARSKGSEWECLARRDSYDVEAWVWSPGAIDDAGSPGDAADGAALEIAGDAGLEIDAGSVDAFAQPGMPRSPPVIYVSIHLLPDACDFGESPLVDGGATYAIDTVRWRILAIHH